MSNYSELPITALCIVSDRSKCPLNYTPIYRSYDTNTETDLWKDSLFGKKINRFICFTKDYPINEVLMFNSDPRIFFSINNFHFIFPLDL